MATISSASLQSLRNEAIGCQRCDIWKCGGQVVFGEGPASSKVLIVGEQPGDQEDRLGHPFVGPAGRVLDAALAAAEISKDDVYITNAVKHFKFQMRGKRRIHQRPTSGEIDICKWWLLQEIDLIKPTVILALGASAIRGVTGKTLPIERNRGHVIELSIGPSLLVSYHPSFILRQRDEKQRHQLRAKLVTDLRRAHRLIAT